MKKIRLVALFHWCAAVALVASCVSEIVPETVSDDAPGGENGKIIVRASTEPETTRAMLSGDDENGYSVLWQADDEISIGGKTFRLISGEGTTDGTFVLESGTGLADGTYDAYYPESYSGDAWVNDQVYVPGNVIGSPMKAEAVVSASSISDLHFTNVGGILRLTVKGSSDIKVKAVEVTSDELADTIKLTCSAPVELNASAGVQFHISMPENAAGYSELKIVSRMLTANSLTASL